MASDMSSPSVDIRDTYGTYATAIAKRGMAARHARGKRSIRRGGGGEGRVVKTRGWVVWRFSAR